MKQSLHLRLGQSLTMTPQLQQAIKLLQMSSLELQTEIQQTLDSNPLLEQEDNLGEITVLDPEATDINGSGEDDSIIIKTSADTIDENRANQTLPDDLEVDSRWDDVYDNTPASPTQPSGPSKNAWQHWKVQNVVWPRHLGCLRSCRCVWRC